MVRALFEAAGEVNGYPEQEERYRPRINAARKLHELVSDLERLEIHSVEEAEGWGT